MNKKLNNLLEYVKANNDYYKKIMNQYDNTDQFIEEFRLTKDDVIDNRMQMFSNIYSGTMYSTMQVNTTSGTSGKTLKVYWAPDDLARSNMCIWRLRKKYYDISPNDMYCSLHTTSYYGARVNKIQKIIPAGNNVSFCKLLHDESSLNEYYEAMCKYRPAWLMVQPGFMSLFVEFMRRKNYKPIESIRYIEFTGELLTEVVRGNVEDYFKCRTANMYGCMETNTIAYECPCGSMHILTDNVFVKTDYDNIYVTSLQNYAFPLINYEVGDKVRLIYEYECQCGIKGPIIKEIYGRSSRQIDLPNGHELNEATISYCLDRAEAVLGIGVKQYSAKYREPILTVFIVADNKNNEWKSSYINLVKDMISGLCGISSIKFQFVDQIEKINSAKFNSKYSILEVEE